MTYGIRIEVYEIREDSKGNVEGTETCDMTAETFASIGEAERIFAWLESSLKVIAKLSKPQEEVRL